MAAEQTYVVTSPVGVVVQVPRGNASWYAAGTLVRLAWWQARPLVEAGQVRPVQQGDALTALVGKGVHRG